MNSPSFTPTVKYEFSFICLLINASAIISPISFSISHFKPEFLNRLDEIIVFNKLEKNNLKSIIENQLAILKNRLTSKNIKILFDLEVVNLLSEKGYSREYGARPLKRLIEKEIGDIIADALINNQIKENSYFTVGVKDGKFKLKITS